LVIPFRCAFGRSLSERLAAIETDVLYETGAVINLLPFHAGADRAQTGLMSALRRDGVDL
jgi:hypothetical protein